MIRGGSEGGVEAFHVASVTILERQGPVNDKEPFGVLEAPYCCFRKVLMARSNNLVLRLRGHD